MALKLLHTADWHLGARFPAFSEDDERRLTRARLDVIERILDLAERHTVDAVLCAGDLFDDPDPGKQWWEGLLALLERRRWTDRPVVLLPGNHDPCAPGSVWKEDHAFRRRLPAFVHVVDRDDFALELPGKDAVVLAAPCRSQAGEKDLALALPDRREGDERIRIGLVHGQTIDIPGCQTSFPIARDAAEKRGLDYLAIGDTHSFREVWPADRVPTVYPGAPEPTSFKEKDAGYAVVVFIRRRGARPRLHPEKVAHWTWREEVCRDLQSLRRLRDTEDLRACVVRLVLDMKLSLTEHAEAEAIVADLTGTEATHGKAGIIVVDAARLHLDASRVDGFGEGLPDPIKSAVDRLKKTAEEQDDEVAKRALCLLYDLVRGRG